MALYRYMLVLQDVGAVVPNANGQAVLWDPDAGGSTFDRAGASSDGTAPRTHAVCSTLVDTDWSTGPMSYLDPFVGNSFHTGYRIAEGSATHDNLRTGTVEKYYLKPAPDGWGWYPIGTGSLRDIALSDMGLQLIDLTT